MVSSEGGIFSLDHLRSKADVSQLSPEELAKLSFENMPKMPEKKTGGIGAWAQQNMLNPALNAGIIEPVRAITHSVNAVTEKVADFKILPELEKLTVPAVSPTSPAGFSQGVFGGLASVIPYAISGKLVGSTLRATGARFGVEGTTAALFKSQKTAMILGAGGYDFFRVPEYGQTRLGNAMGGAAGFAVFESMNPLIKRLPGLPAKGLGMLAIGVAGSSTQFGLSEFISKGEVNTDMLGQVAIQGGALNVILPGTQRGLLKLANDSNVALGRGIYGDQWLQSKFAQQNPEAITPYVRDLIQQNPWVRIQPGLTEPKYIPGKGGAGARIEIPPNLPPEHLGLLLYQHSQSKPGTAAEGQFQRAAELLRKGDTTQAREVFSNLRLAQELGLRQANHIIGRQVNGPEAMGMLDAAALARDLPTKKLVGDLTYGELWDREFDHFVATEGKYRPPTQYLGTDNTVAFQNQDMRPLFRAQHDHVSLDNITRTLAGNKSLRLVRYDSGGHSAVTVDSKPTLQSAVDGLLIFQWDRDNIFQALAERAAKNDPALGAALEINPHAAQAGLTASLKHHFQNQHRFTDIITDKVTGLDLGKRPNIRYNPISLAEVGDPWGHAQNDSLAFVDFMLFHQLNKGEIKWNDPSIQPYAEAYAALLPTYFKKIHAWEDWDLGAWEDKRGEHASSIGTVVAALREQRQFMQQHGPIEYKANDGNTYKVTEADVAEILTKAEAKLGEILPNEFIRGENGETRHTDAALVNALFLGAVSGKPIVSDAVTLRIINTIEKDLMGPIGIARYPKDVWDGRVNRTDLGPREEAQWSHVSPMISVIFGEMYRRTGNPEFLARQTEHFNRSLGTVNERWKIPEAYITDPQTGRWISDANEPLAWAQSATLLALDGMRQTVRYQQQNGLVTAPVRQQHRNIRDLFKIGR